MNACAIVPSRMLFPLAACCSVLQAGSSCHYPALRHRVPAALPSHDEPFLQVGVSERACVHAQQACTISSERCRQQFLRTSSLVGTSLQHHTFTLIYMQHGSEDERHTHTLLWPNRAAQTTLPCRVVVAASGIQPRGSVTPHTVHRCRHTCDMAERMHTIHSLTLGAHTGRTNNAACNTNTQQRVGVGGRARVVRNQKQGSGVSSR